MAKDRRQFCGAKGPKKELPPPPFPRHEVVRVRQKTVKAELNSQIRMYRQGRAPKSGTRSSCIQRRESGAITQGILCCTALWRGNQAVYRFLAFALCFLRGIACQEGATGSRNCISLHFGRHQIPCCATIFVGVCLLLFFCIQGYLFLGS